MGFELRPYQQPCTSAIWAWMQENDGNPILVAPVGAGKSVLIADLIRQAIAADPEARILVITHNADLVRQNYAKLLAVWPNAPAGIYSAALKKRDMESQIVFATIQSIYKKAYDIGRVHLILVDEAHTISRNTETMWGRFLTDVRVVNFDVRMIGYTGTEWRLDSGPLIGGEDALFHGVAHKISMIDLIRQGYLAPIVSQPGSVRVDTSGVAKRGGEYISGDLARATDRIIDQAVPDFVEKGRDRRTWMIFCVSVANAKHVTEAVRRHGISCEIVTAETPADERDRILTALKDGTLRAVANVSCLTTGIDVPPLDMLVMLRSTMSSGLFIQMAGRGTRLSPETGKTDCLMLDYARLLETHGPIDLISPPRFKSKGDGEAPTKQCPDCETLLPIHVMTCPVCQHEFPPPPAEKERLEASALPALSIHMQAQWVKVYGMDLSRHQGKDGKRDTLKVVYSAGLASYPQWVAIEHDGHARTKALSWWVKSRGAQWAGNPAPYSIDEAIRRRSELRVPTQILIRPQGRFFEILEHSYE